MNEHSEAPASPEMLQAYRLAKYVVDVAGGLELRVGLHNRKLDVWLNDQGTAMAAFITPENPFSQRLDEAQNNDRHQLFVSELRRRQIDFVGGYGVDDAGQWPQEKSYLIPVASDAQADQLAEAFGQNAYLLCQVGQAVKLICRN